MAVLGDIIAATRKKVNDSRANSDMRELNLDVLCEVHDEEELGRALDAGCEMIGVNNRDLKTFKVDLNVALRLSQMLPLGVVAVAESGIGNGADISRLRAAGYNGFLIG